ncbi:acyltransferase family protein [Microbacterium sp. XT11]|uniref:acyltransferase family protein n=1 Tax=Microbacterium sp. XT11 TaxID=367477 RepID=UPI000831D30C|nr:acyltransferase [Microbacterium sp. XT11]
MSRRLLRASEFPYRENSLNLFRLVLAFLVLLAHAFYIVGRDDSPGFNGENLGGWAVIGFFVISGFLITRSRFRTDPGTFLVHRIARIVPAFIVCLIVTAFVFGPAAQMMAHGSLAGYLTNAPTPLEYIWGNLFLHVDQYQIGSSLSTVPYPDAWNGSLWTLYFEFLCYLTVWLLGGLAIYRRSIVFVAFLWVVSVVVRILSAAGIDGGLDGDFALFARLLPYFLGGSLIYLVIQRWGLVPLIGLLAIPLAAVLMVFVPVAGGPVAAPLIGYALLYLATVVPQPRWVARNDVSYGFYIYAWPVQQLVVLAGGAALGIAVYVLITVVVTFVLAWLSWTLVERRFMRIARGASRDSSPDSGPRSSLPDLPGPTGSENAPSVTR